MRVVLDTSAAIEVVLDRQNASRFSEALRDAEEVLAPELFVAELANAFWKYHHFETLSLTVCDRSIGLGLDLVDILVPCKELHREAFLLARVARRPVYDMFYLALAKREDALLLTLDSTLRKVAEREGISTL